MHIFWLWNRMRRGLSRDLPYRIILKIFVENWNWIDPSIVFYDLIFWFLFCLTTLFQLHRFDMYCVEWENGCEWSSSGGCWSHFPWPIVREGLQNNTKNIGTPAGAAENRLRAFRIRSRYANHLATSFNDGHWWTCTKFLDQFNDYEVLKEHSVIWTLFTWRFLLHSWIECSISSDGLSYLVALYCTAALLSAQQLAVSRIPQHY